MVKIASSLLLVAFFAMPVIAASAQEEIDLATRDMDVLDGREFDDELFERNVDDDSLYLRDLAEDIYSRDPEERMVEKRFLGALIGIGARIGASALRAAPRIGGKFASKGAKHAIKHHDHNRDHRNRKNRRSDELDLYVRELEEAVYGRDAEELYERDFEDEETYGARV